MESENQRREFATALTRHINESEFTPAQIAHELHVNPDELNAWLAGTDIPWMRALEIVDLLGVPLPAVMVDA